MSVSHGFVIKYDQKWGNYLYKYRVKFFSSVCAMWLEHNWVGKIGKVFAAVLPLLFLFKIIVKHF